MEHQINLTPIRESGLDLEQYFGLWAVAEEQFLAMFNRVAQLNLAAHIQVNGDQKIEAAERPATSTSAADVMIGIIDVNGTLMKRGTSLSSSSSLINIRRVIRSAARDPEIDAILLRIDSPGGTLSGTQEVAEEVRKAREAKPVFAFVEDLAASAAYWIASQAEKVYANTPTAIAGSIGTFIGLYDYSEAAAKAGVKAIVIRAGELKGAGFPGTEITDAQKAYWQEIVDKAQSEFTAAVAAGRNRPTAEVAERYVTGRVYVAADAEAMGMIDGVRSFDQAIAELTTRVRAGRQPRRPRMSEGQLLETVAAVHAAATIGELKAACPGADADFLMKQLEASATVDTAQRAWIAEQQKRLEAAEKAKAEAEAKIKEAEAKAAAPGVEALGSGEGAKAEEAADPVARWFAAIEAKEKEGVTPRSKAIAAVVHGQPELHQAYLAAVNSKK